MSLRSRVLDHFRRNPEAWLSRSQIGAELGLSTSERKALQGVMTSLARSGDLEFIHRRYRLPKPSGAVEGIFHAARGGFGFITPEKGVFGKDIFVPSRCTMGAFEGDRVRAVLASRQRGDSPEARVTAVLSRSDRPVVGIVQGGYLLPMGASMEPVGLPPSRPRDGTLAAVRLEPRDGPPTAASVEAIGALDDPHTPIRAAEIRFCLSNRFPEEVEREASCVGTEVSPGDLQGRADFRTLTTVTIDPVDAKDFDDAISVRREGDGFRLWVHIADVSHYVSPGSPIDEEARRRGNSTYLPGVAYPMLPHSLSSHLCSLVPGADRLTFTAEMLLDARGLVRESRFHKGVIRSSSRLTYDQAQRILEGEGEAAPEVAELLQLAKELSEVLFKRRLSLGTLDLDLPEADLRFGLSGRVEEVLPSVRLRSHRIVEEAMLACNEAVAVELVKRGAPALFRVHEDPNPEKLEALRPLLNALGLGAQSRGDLADPFVLQALLERAQSHRASKLVAYLVLRAMAQARYSEELLPHYGLGFKAYCHFTSPIRRYPDLLVHRSLSAALRSSGNSPEDLAEEASHCSRTERASDQAEREVVAWYQMAFLAGRLGDAFQAMILGFNRFGARIELLDHLIEGICPFHAMASDYMTVGRDGLAARGRYSGAVLRVGDIVEVKLVRVDRLAGEAQFALEDLPSGRESGRKKKGRRR